MRHFIINASLIVLFVAEFCFPYLPKSLHEILGLLLVVVVIVHFAMNFRRFLALFKRMTPKKFFSIELNIALLLGTLIILLTGLCMSNYLFPDLANPTLRRNMTIHNLHTATPYVMTALIGMHIGLHWHEVKYKVLKFLGAEEFFRRWKRVVDGIILTLAAVGVLDLFLNRFFDRILMKHIFATPATDLPAPIFAFLLIDSVIFFAVVTHFIAKKVFKE